MKSKTNSESADNGSMSFQSLIQFGPLISEKMRRIFLP